MSEDQEKVEDETTSSTSDEEKTQSDEFDFEEESSSEDTAPHKRSAEARINQLIAKNKELEERLETAESMMKQPRIQEPVPVPKVEAQSSPEVQKALDFLREKGFATQEDLKKYIQDLNDRQVLLDSHRGLETRYDGEDGRPKYKREEIEKYMREHAVYDPEVAYKALYETELLDWHLKQVEGKRKQRPYVEQAGIPTGTQGDQAITREKIAKSALTPKGRAWYERNREKILELASKGLLK